MTDLVEWAYCCAEDLLGGHLPRRWMHVKGVAKRARVAERVVPTADRELLVAAALLHDVGYSPQLARTGFHPLDGARWLAEEGVDGRLVGLVAHHSCAYREARLRGYSADLTAWLDEKTSLRDAVWWADMTTSPGGELVTFDGRIEEIQNRYGSQDLVTSFIHQAKPELQAAVERTEARLRIARLSYEK